MTAPTTPPSRPNSLPALVAAVRPHQWAKNLLIFVPLAAAHLFTAEAFGAALVAAAAFSLAASAGYLANDLADIDADRRHPENRHRPIASGRVTPGAAKTLAGALLAAAVALAGLGLGGRFLGTLVAYLILTFTYSAWIKRLYLWDVACLTVLYTLRIFAGAVAVDVVVSPWLLAFGLAIFLSLALLKRYNEVALFDRARAGSGSGSGPEAPRGGSKRPYRRESLKLLYPMGLGAGYLSLLTLALYLNSPAVEGLYGRQWILWLWCPALFLWITRIWERVRRRGISYDPLVFALKDALSWIVFAFLLIVLFAAI